MVVWCIHQNVMFTLRNVLLYICPIMFFYLLLWQIAQLHAISERFYHRQIQINEVKSSPDLWSSGVKGTSSFFQNVCRCSKIDRNRQFVNVRPFEIAYMTSEQDCVVRCTSINSDMNVACTSLNYCSYDRRCELFQVSNDQPSYSGPGRCISVNGCSYYTFDSACLATLTSAKPGGQVTTSATQTISSITAGTTSTSFETSTTSAFITNTGQFETTTSFSEITTSSSNGGGGGGGGGPSQSRKSCPSGQSAVYSRAEGYTDPRINIPDNQIQNVASAGACQTECDQKAECQSFDYLSNSRKCNLYNSVNKDPLQQEAGVEHYDIICVPGACSGIIERIPNKVQFSTPTTVSVHSMNECINQCLSRKPCLSVSYFPTAAFDKDNCLMSEQSRKTDPNSFFDEKNSAVDYYGLDSCTSSRAKNKLIRQQASSPVKKSLKPPVVVRSNDPAAQHLPSAKQYRQMLIDAQKQRATRRSKRWIS